MWKTAENKTAPGSRNSALNSGRICEQCGCHAIELSKNEHRRLLPWLEAPEAGKTVLEPLMNVHNQLEISIELYVILGGRSGWLTAAGRSC